MGVAKLTQAYIGTTGIGTIGPINVWVVGLYPQLCPLKDH